MGQPPPRSLPTDAVLARLIEESLAARPELAKAEAVVRARQERAPQVGALPDPMLQVGIQNDGFTSIEIGRMDTSFVSFMATQTFPWFGRRGLRKELATLDAGSASAQVRRARLSAEADVRRAYLGLLLARDRLALLERLDALWRESAGMTRILYEAGKGPQSDVLRADLELRRLEQRRIGLEGEATRGLQSLNRLCGHPLDTPLVTTTRVRDLPAPATLDATFSAERAASRSPELDAARLETTRAERSVALARSDYYPDVTVGAGLMVRGQIPPMWLVTVGVPVPIWAGDRQSRAVREARAWESAAHKDVTTFEQVVRLRSEERHTTFSTLLRTLDVYDRGLLVQSEATAESTLSQYKVGKVTFASVLDANAGLIADHEGYLEAVAAAHGLLIDEVEGSLAEAPMPGGGARPSAAMPGAGSVGLDPTGGPPAMGANGGSSPGSSSAGM
jgi:outer membrane protein TolC